LVKVPPCAVIEIPSDVGFHSFFRRRASSIPCCGRNFRNVSGDLHFFMDRKEGNAGTHILLAEEKEKKT